MGIGGLGAGPLRVAVLVERAWDPFSVELDPVTGAVDERRAVSVPAPGSLDAVELGLRLGSVAAYAIGGAEAEEVLRECLGMGAAAAVRAADLGGLSRALRTGGYDLVLVSWRSGHESPNPLGPLVAGLLDLPQATAVDALVVQAPGEAVVRRRLGGGEREELALSLPAVIAIEPGIVTPRLGSPAAVLNAQATTIPVLEAENPASPQASFLGYRPPRPVAPRTRPPDSTLSVEARIAQVVGLGAPEHRRELVTGSGEELAARIVTFLEERGFL
jgi:electron transfer flavoprotein alpha/beta subunit